MFPQFKMTDGKDFEAFVDFLEERGVPVLEALGNGDLGLQGSSASGDGDSSVKGSRSTSIEKAAPSNDDDDHNSVGPSNSKSSMTKKAIVSTFLRRINAAGSNRVGAGGNGPTIAEIGGAGEPSGGERGRGQNHHQQQEHPSQNGQQFEHQPRRPSSWQDQRRGNRPESYSSSNPASQHGGSDRAHHNPTASTHHHSNSNKTHDRTSAGPGMVAIRPHGLPPHIDPRDPRVASGLSGIRSFNKLPGPVLRTCQHEGCSRRPSFNHPGLRAKFCSAHREINMVDVAHRVRCQREVRSRMHLEPR